MYQRLGKSGLSIVNISIDREPGDKAALLELVKKNGLTFPVLWDSSAVTGKRYKVPNRLPYEVLLDAEGKVLKVLVGPNPDDLHKLEAEIRAIIGAAEAPGSAAHAQPAPQAAPQVQQPPAAAPAAGAQQTR
jgi:peroxiredoxin